MIRQDSTDPKIRGRILDPINSRIRITDPDLKTKSSDHGSSDPDLKINLLGSGSHSDLQIQLS